MESAPTICKAITIKKKIEFTSKQGLRTRNVWLAALSVSLTTAISRKHSLLRRFSYKQFTGLFALRIAFPE